MNTKAPIGVLVVDDHAIVREGLCAVLEANADIRVIGDAADGQQAVEKALQLNPDVIVMDIQMPHKNGISAIQDIIAQRPGARIVVLSSFSDDTQIVESVRAGAQGYVLKSDGISELANAIRLAHAGEVSLNPLVARRLVESLTQEVVPRLTERLTIREMAILPLLAQGLTNREIAQRLDISIGTVGGHVSHMISKAGVENRTQLSMLAVQQGLASPYYENGNQLGTPTP
jgi:DNA-binding NarL/FixJ family response regulator